MQVHRKLLVSLVATAVVLSITALPGLAAKPEARKTIGANFTSVPNTTYSFDVKLWNTTPGGTSNPNSFLIEAPAGYDVTGADYVSGTNANPDRSIVADPSLDEVRVSGLDPLKRSADGSINVVIRVHVSVATTGCGTSTSAPWTVTGFTGSNLTGDTFITNEGTRTTTVTSTCGIRFNPAPSNGEVGETIPTTVEVVSGNAVIPNYTGTITLTKTAGGTLSGTGAVPITNGSGSANFSLSGSTPGDYTVQASATNVSGTASASFTLFSGEINCGQSAEEGELLRGASNKDGSTCVIVDYTYTKDGFGEGDVDDDLVNLVWDTASQPAAAFEYTIPWDAESVSPTTGLPTRVTEVSWEKDGTGAPIFVPGRACWSDQLPSPYGTLDGGATVGATSITVSGAPSGLSTPFDIVIGTERMRVTATSGGTWTVSRAIGGTTAAAHDGGAPVMSTPLPVAGGEVVPICIASEGWAAAGQNLVAYTTRIFDIGDGTIRRR